MAALDPGFVRSTKSYLTEANLVNIKRELKIEEEEAMRNPDKVSDRNAVLSSGMNFMKTLECGSRNGKMSLTARKVLPPSITYFETYNKMNSI